MRAVGNIEQWNNGNPTRDTLLQDIEDGNSYLVEDDGIAVATFAFVEGPDITYEHIYDGWWLDEMGEYYVIHRLASAPNTHGIMKAVFDYCFTRTTNIRIDTHYRLRQYILHQNRPVFKNQERRDLQRLPYQL